MTDRFKNKYRIPSARASWWNYGADGAYYITICTKDRITFFGEVVDDLMHLSEIGEIVQQCWLEIPTHFPFVILDEFVVMPNHMHGIIVIDKQNAVNIDNVETRLIASLQNNDNKIAVGGVTKDKNAMLTEGVPKIIRWFKGRSSYEIRKIHADFAWQPRYHDRIIRDQLEHERIVSYIQDNPINWQHDKLYT